MSVSFETSYEDSAGHVFLRSVDLSEGGISLVSDAQPPVGSAVRIVLELPGQPEIQRFRGEVVRHLNGPRAGFAVVFHRDRSSGGALSAVRGFVRAKPASVPRQ